MNMESSVNMIQSIESGLNYQNSVCISCHTCTMPGRTLMTYPHNQHSAPFNVPYSQQYEPITMTFYVSSDMRERHFFEVWQTAVVNINDNSVNFFDEYTSDIKISQLDISGNITYSVTLYAAYPMSISDMSYTYSENDQVQNTSVTMSYKLWKSSYDLTDIIIS